jgi:hypothetical protein
MSQASSINLESVDDSLLKPQVPNLATPLREKLKQPSRLRENLSALVEQHSNPNQPTIGDLRRFLETLDLPEADTSDSGETLESQKCFAGSSIYADPRPDMFSNSFTTGRPIQQSCGEAVCCSAHVPGPQTVRADGQSAMFHAQMRRLDMHLRNLTTHMEEMNTQLGKAGSQLAESGEELGRRLKREIEDACHALKHTIRKAGREVKETQAGNESSAANEGLAADVRVLNRSAAIVALPPNSTTMTVNIGGMVISNVVITKDCHVHIVPGNGIHISKVNSCSLAGTTREEN